MVGAARYGDANLNGMDNDDNYRAYQQQREDAAARRLTRQYMGQPPVDANQLQQQEQQPQFVFKEFTRDSLAKIQKRKLSRAKRCSVANVEASKQSLEPDPFLASGVQLPRYILRRVPPELIGRPIEDIDPYYADKETFVIISRGKELIRFSANKALWLFGPFHPIRRIVLYILVSSVFNLFVILTILINCILMTIQGSEAVERTIEDTEIIFTIIYTFEFILKVMARGFLFGEFAYLHDPWNILDITVITLSYLTIVIQDLGNLSVMRTFRVLRALKTVAVIPGMKTIVGAVIDSVKNLKDVVVLTLFSLSVFSLLGLQIYMGLLTQKCILNGPNDMNDTHWFEWNNNASNWLLDPDSETKSYKLCGNTTGAQSCPPDRTCLQGFGPNPDYGFTNFDTFGWSLICSFRLMTQDYWEGLYMQVLKTAGSWHIIFFIVSIFLGSIYLMNLILAIVAMSYNELQRRAEEEEEANMEDEAAFLESCRLMELQELGSASGGGGGGDSNNSGRGSQLGLSYRPSIEIGLVGQTLLAGFCQNGLLDEAAREKLDRQMIFSPAFANPADPGGCANHRSRSLCISTEQQNRARANNQWMQYGLLVPYRGSYNQVTAASLNELSRRRKSSCRTDDSGAVVGQRRLMRDVSSSGQRLEAIEKFKRGQQQQQQQQYQPLPRLHASSQALMPSVYVGDGSSGGGGGDSRRSSKMVRSSLSSDKDLSPLRQRAAMIRIGQTLSRQSSGGSGLDAGGLFVSSGATHSRSSSMQVGGPGSHHRASSSLWTGASTGNRLNTARNSLSSQSDRYKSEAAICGQPSGAHPLGRMVAKSNLAHLSSSSLQPGRGSFRHHQHHQNQHHHNNNNNHHHHHHHHRRHHHRRPSESPSRRCSHSSGHTTDRPDSTAPSSPIRHAPVIDKTHHGRGSSRSFRSGLSRAQLAKLQTSSINVNDGELAPSSLSRAGNKSCSLRTLRLSTNRLNVNDPVADQDRMRHLSVENFQQFGTGLRLGQSPALALSNDASGLSIAGSPCQVAAELAPQHQRPFDHLARKTSDTACYGLPNAMLIGHFQHHASLRNRRDYLEQARLSVQRRRSSALTRGTRHGSILPSSSIGPSTYDQHQQRQQYLQGHRQSVGGGGGNQLLQQRSQIRRLSRDFVRHADGWSRLSMSGNIDLRRLLRLWAQSNPYQNQRSSIGSCSLYSQASQMTTSRFNVDSPQKRPSRHQQDQQQQQQQRADFSMDDKSATEMPPLQRASPGRTRTGHGQRARLHDQSANDGSQNLNQPPYEVLSAVNGRDYRYQSDARAFGTALPLDDNLAAADQMSIGARDKCLAYCLSCLDILCIWECCEGWIKVQQIIALVVFDPFTELFILLCILINTLFMALDNDDVDDQMRRLFEQGNYFFTATFVVEAVMKIIALSPKFYFREGFNVFDAIIVGLSLLELGLEGVYGLSVLRTFRLLRVFRLARSWPTMNVLISICGHAISDLGNLTFVLAIIVFIFAVMGMQLFGNKYTPASFADGAVPRWNFKDFMHSFMIVFRILCAEWIEPLWDCMNAAPKEICIPFFISAVIIGNLVLLNLFLALLLASFGSSNLSGPQADHVDTRKLQQAIGRFKRFGRFVRRTSARLIARLANWLLCRKRPRNGISDPTAMDEKRAGGGVSGVGGGGQIKSHIATMSRQERQQKIERRTEELKSKIRRSPEQHHHLKQLARNQTMSSQHD